MHTKGVKYYYEFHIEAEITQIDRLLFNVT